jgi:hypothetical protein
MTKLTDTLRRALEKKQARLHPEANDAHGDTVSTKVKTAPPVPAGKPVKKVTGRGR